MISDRRVSVTLISVIFLLTGACARTPAEKEARFLQKGKALVEKHDYTRAMLEFKSAGQAMPKDAEPYYRLALVYIAQQDTRSAFAFLKKAVALNPKHAEAQVLLAQFQSASSEKDTRIEAQERLKAVLAAKPDDAAALNALAALEFRLGNIEEAQNNLNTALRSSPNDLRSSVALANLKLSQKDIPGAEATMKAAVQSAPQSASAAVLLAEFYLGAGNKPQAEAQARRAVQLNPKASSGLLMIAALEAESGRTPQAEQTYKQISALPEPALRHVHADFLFQEGKREEAIAELRQLAKTNPEDRDIRGRLVADLLALGKTQEAEQVLSEALKHNSKDVDALLQRSALLVNAGQLTDAEKDLQSILHSEPTSAEAHYRLAKIAALRGSTLTQRQELGEALRLDPKFLAARIDYSALLRDKDPKASLDLLDQATEAQKKTAPYIVARNWALMAAKNNIELRKGLDAALLLSRSPEVLYQEALVSYNEKNYTATRSSLEEALKQDPEYSPALNLLAQSYIAQGNPGKALESLQSYVSRKPNSPLLLSIAGFWQANLQHRDLARKSFSAAVIADPGYVPARLALADLDLRDGNLEQARTSLRAVLTKQPANVAARIRMAGLEQQSGNSGAARQDFLAVLQTEPNNVSALNDLAYNLSVDKPDEALKYAQNAVELSPETAITQDTLGWVYYRKGVYDSALRYFARAVATEPTAVHRYHLALAYAKTGDRQLAHKNLEAALKLDPKLSMPEALDK